MDGKESENSSIRDDVDVFFPFFSRIWHIPGIQLWNLNKQTKNDNPSIILESRPSIIKWNHINNLKKIWTINYRNYYCIINQFHILASRFFKGCLGLFFIYFILRPARNYLLTHFDSKSLLLKFFWLIQQDSFFHSSFRPQIYIISMENALHIVSFTGYNKLIDISWCSLFQMNSFNDNNHWAVIFIFFNKADHSCLFIYLLN